MLQGTQLTTASFKIYMRIDSLTIKNFKAFADRKFDFHPEFNLVIGVNGTGKSSLIDALAISLSQWQRGPGFGTEADLRTIDDAEVFIKQTPSNKNQQLKLEPQFPSAIVTEGTVAGEQVSWFSYKTDFAGNRLPDEKANLVGIEHSELPLKNFKRYVRSVISSVIADQNITLPLIACYGIDRLRLDRNHENDIDAGDLTIAGYDVWLARENNEVVRSYVISRLSAYKNCYRASMSVERLNAWIEEVERSTNGDGTYSHAKAQFKVAVLGCLHGARELRFDEGLNQIVVEFEDGRIAPFCNLSDGQKIILALVGDIARRAITLNPQLKDSALSETPGVVLIDELDLHLHPTWQRRIIADLRRTFPQIQFICTTHSPFLIQTLQSGDELLSLDNPVGVDPSNLGIEAIAAGLMGVAAPEASPNYMAMLCEAKDYLAELDEASRAPAERLESYKQKLAERLAPFAKNPAFQAVLEAERASKLGQ